MDPLGSNESEGQRVFLEEPFEGSADQLGEALLAGAAEQDMPRLRQLVMLAEDTAFSAEESERLAPCLLDLALRHRDSSDPEDEPFVWSAIRTGASMLRPQEAHSLLPLLQPGHAIETSLVTVKMLGRVFEAQPPGDVDQHADLVAAVKTMVDSLLNPYAIATSQGAAMAQLALYALAAMASSETLGVMRTVRQLDCEWFTRRTGRRLRELRGRWTAEASPAGSAPVGLLDRALMALGG